jgi:hypothetical protein
MNKTMRRLLTAAARNYQVGGFITWDVNTFGQRVYAYNDLPIIIVDKDNENNDILPFEEAATSGTSTATSIYCVSFGEGMFTGIQGGDMQVRDLGEIDSAPVYRTRVEWDCGIAIYHGKAAARLYSIANSTVTT